ncbi:P-selectin-like [Rhinophrynus dorsalis]
MGSVRDQSNESRAGCTWKPFRLLCFAAVGCGLLKSPEASAWTYDHSQNTATWDEARAWCKTHFTDMVAIQNKKEISYLNQHLPFHANYYWIGIRKVNQVWTWVGTNKSLTPEATNWAPREPNNKGKQQDCVEIYIKRARDRGKWNDEPCNKKKIALCYLANCNASSCSQHGECVETIGNYTCDCQPGYYGAECEHVIKCTGIYNIHKEATMSCTHPLGHFAYTSSCIIQCMTGFVLLGSSSLQCSAQGNWTADIPQCEAVSCGALQSPSHGWMNCSHVTGDFQYNSSCGFDCAEGFLLNGSKTVLCNSSGDWTDPTPTCAAVSCQALQSLSYGQVNCSHVFGDFQYNSSCSFTCDNGFVLNGSQSVVCQVSGAWSELTPTCAAVSCQALQIPSYGRMNCSHVFGDFQYNSSCSFTCDNGFVLNGSESVVCQASGAWSDLTPTCAAVSCQALQSPSYGRMNCSHVFGDFKYNSRCSFTCDSGFVLNGSESVVCQDSGAWLDLTPTCSAVSCQALQSPSYGQMNCSHVFGDFQYNSSCSFTCDNGFVLNGSESVVCQASGAWSDLTPTCAAVSCQALQSLSYGQVNCSHVFGDFQYNSSCSFTCDNGFVLNGSQSVVCQVSGAWSELTPTCAAVSCQALQIPSYGRMNCSHVFGDFQYNSSCSFTCDNGFVLNGSESVVCQASGAWSDLTPTCAAVSCQALQSPSYGRMNCSHVFGDFKYNSRCSFTCDSGFVLNGSESVVCQDSGAWLDLTPTCSAVSCQALQSPSYGQMNYSHVFGDFQYNSSCSFTCDNGFVLNGSESVVCQASGAWSDLTPTCAAVSCQALQSPSYGRISCSHVFGDFKYNSRCSFTCDSGFVLNGSVSVVCQASGAWLDLTPTCAAVSCQALQSPSYGQMNCSHVFGDFQYTSSCSFTCDNGFVLNGSESVVCQASGAWSDLTPTCAAVSCQALQSPSYGQMNCSHVFGDFQYNSICSFTCDSGFVLNGSESVVCQASRAWLDLTPTCSAVSCQALQSPSYGQMNCSHVFGDFQYNFSCSFTCDNGFVLNGSESVLCQASGAWSDLTPTCAAVSCEALQSPSYGRMNCSHVFGNFQYNSSCSFTSDDGFVLNGSESVVCQASGAWSDLTPTCAAVSCQALQSPSYGQMNCSHVFRDFKYNSRCSFICENGFVLNGTESIVCQASGAWSDLTPACAAVSCEALQSPSYGRMSCSHVFGDFQYNSSCSFTCVNGFVLNGSESVVCQASGAWSDSTPTCAVVKCNHLSSLLPMKINCSHPTGNFSFGSECQFNCSEGYTLNGTARIHCQSSGDWSDRMPICEAHELSFVKPLLLYYGGSVLAAVGLILTGTLILFTIKHFRKKACGSHARATLKPLAKSVTASGAMERLSISSQELKTAYENSILSGRCPCV